MRVIENYDVFLHSKIGNSLKKCKISYKINYMSLLRL